MSLQTKKEELDRPIKRERAGSSFCAATFYRVLF